jgi:hypothetical protein
VPLSGWQERGELCSTGSAISTGECLPQTRGSPVLNSGLRGSREHGEEELAQALIKGRV